MRMIMIVVVGFVAIVSVSGLILAELGPVAQLAGKLYEGPYTTNTALRQIDAEVLHIGSVLQEFASIKPEKTFKAAAKDIADTDKSIDGLFKTVGERYTGDPAMLEKAKKAYESWTPIRQKIVDAALNMDFTTGPALLAKESPDKVIEIEQSLKPLIAAATSQAAAFAADARVRQHSALVTATITMVVGFLALMGLSWMIAESITRAMERLEGATARLASGELDLEVPETRRTDEIGDMARAVEALRQSGLEKVRLEAAAEENQATNERERTEREAIKAQEGEALQAAVLALADGLGQLSAGNLTTHIGTPFVPALEKLRNDFNASVDRLRQLLSGIGVTAETIRSGSAEIRSASDDLSLRTEQQAASLEETSAALAEITANMEQAAKRAQEAGEVATVAKDDAEKSGVVVRNAVDAMSQIEQSSGKIVQIITVIDDIAFQTNLLALNAGVEAARAGDAGRGFAVVAQEVRELAQRSANAAREIKTLIDTSRNHVSSGVTLVNETGEALQTIEKHVLDIHQHVGAIVVAAEEQSVGLKQVNEAIGQMDRMTQQNAAMVEQTTASVHTLAKEAGGLSESLGAFSLGAATDAGVAALKSTARMMAESGSDAAAATPAPVRPAAPRRARQVVNGPAVAAADADWEEF